MIRLHATLSNSNTKGPRTMASIVLIDSIIEVPRMSGMKTTLKGLIVTTNICEVDTVRLCQLKTYY